ncbi:hypothetical protein FA13DRAFT_1793304 [Coprinellus micaceus]|uniref:Uncharacterized protein n=1 Tax=Coprinellus micaceus TaxID=71717 RepID=A0A4Y7T5H8_COPMI|nr:hypothetical protein FA13DRAFT_1793304 [Coprinellus micaceus]
MVDQKSRPVRSSTQQAADEEEGVFVNNEKPQTVDTTKRGGFVQPVSEEVMTAEFIPLYIVGSLCQAGARPGCPATTRRAGLFLTISAVTQLYAIFALLNGSKNRGLPKRNRAIHLIAKSRAALAMMLLWKTWGTTDTIHPPTPTQQVNNLSFLLIFAMSSGPDPTMGLCLTYVLFSLALGPYTSTYYVPPTPLESALPEPSSRAEAILHQVKARIPIGVKDGGWHDTFAWLSQRAVHPSTDDEDEEEEWIDDEEEYEDGSEEYEMRGGPVGEGEERHERSGGPQEDVLLLYHEPFDLPDQPKQPGRPNFVLVVDPPTPNREATRTPSVE